MRYHDGVDPALVGCTLLVSVATGLVGLAADSGLAILLALVSGVTAVFIDDL